MHHYLASLVDFSETQDHSQAFESEYPLRAYSDPTEWQRRKAEIDAIRSLVQTKLETAFAEDAAAEDALAALMAAQPLLGGQLVLCDLAGADYGELVMGLSIPELLSCVYNRAAQPCVTDERDAGKDMDRNELKESAAINKSLLALKNCLRSIAAVPGAPRRPPFRDSILTRILESALQPTTTGRCVRCIGPRLVLLSHTALR